MRLSFNRTLEFLDLLEAPLSTIAPYVQHLRLEEDRARNEDEVRWLNAILPRLTALFAVEILSIVGARFEMLETEDTTSFFARLQMLKKLRLTLCTFGTLSQLTGALGASVSLEDLSLYGLTIQSKWDSSDVFDNARRRKGIAVGLSESFHNPPPFHLKSLTTNYVDRNTEFMKWLASSTPIPSVVETWQLSTEQVEDWLNFCAPSTLH